MMAEDRQVADVWRWALHALCDDRPAAAEALIDLVARLRECGGTLFEVIAGTPADLFGARLTFQPGPDRNAFATAAGLDEHPWGPPDWIGVRTDTDGTVYCKAYHRQPPPHAIAHIHRGLPPGCEPVMAALDGEQLEVYAVEPGQLTWDRFAASCLEPLGVPAAEPEVRLLPRARAFGMSVRRMGDEVSALSLFAFRAALQKDERVQAEWTAGMDAADAVRHDVALGAVASLGSINGRRYGLLAWHYDRTGIVSRAASLRVPPAKPSHEL